MIGQVLESIGEHLTGINKMRAGRDSAELPRHNRVTQHPRERRPLSQNRSSRVGLDDLLVQRSNLRRKLEYAEHAGETNGAGDEVLEQHYSA